MALPAQALEKLSNSAEKTTGVYSQLLMLSLSMAILSIFLFLGLSYGYQPYLASQIDKLDTQIDNFGKEIPADKQAEMATFYSQIVNLRTVLNNHSALSPFWGWLEKNTLPNVYFSKVVISTATNQVTLQGGAKSNEDIMSQLSIFEKSPDVERLVFGNITSAQGWQFTATLFMKKSMFKTQISPAP